MSTFPLGQWLVRRSGFGAMQLAGPWASGPPDRAGAIEVLQGRDRGRNRSHRHGPVLRP